MRKRGSDLHLVSLVLSLANINKCINSNSEPEKCYPTKSTIPLASLVKGELLLLSFVQPTIEGLPHRTLSSPQPLQKDNNPSPHVCPFIQYYNTSINHQSVHRLIRQPLKQLHRKTGAKCRNNSTLPCSHYREIKQQQ